jgi:glycosyltransferase involved in cell wall biosynthesis
VATDTAVGTDVVIVMPIYNGAPFVGEAIRSVLAQTSRSWRMLVVDDASEDDSARIARSVDDPRISHLRNAANLGLYATLAKTIASLDCEWVVILMQDDRLRPEFLSRLADAVHVHPGADGFWPSTTAIDAAGDAIDGGRISRGAAGEYRAGEMTWRTAMRRGCIWMISGSCTRRRIFAEVPLRTDLPHCGDFDWFLRASRSHTFVELPDALVELRQHPGQASARHMREGRNLAELFVVVDDQLRRFPGGLPIGRVAELGLYRAAQCARTLLGNLLRGHGRSAPTLLRTAFRFLGLPARVLARRLGGPSRLQPGEVSHVGRR